MSLKKSLPNGMRDRLFREAFGSEILENQIIELLNQRGYQRIATPTIEFEDVFNVVENEGNLYRFYDEKGRTQVLRPDVTLPIGRVIATTGVKLPLKLAYSGKIFRGGQELEGKKNELTQVGIELIGYHSVKAELECILCSYAVLKELLIPDIHFELGHAGILPIIEAELHFNREERQQFRKILKEKNISEMQVFAEQHNSEYSDFLRQLPTMFGPMREVIEFSEKLLPKTNAVTKLLEELLLLEKYLLSAAPDILLTVDLGMVAKKEYYTGMIFNAYSTAIAEDFLSGGRYDRLLEKFDRAATAAVGVALNLDAMIETQYNLGILPKQVLVQQLVFADVANFAQAQKMVTAECQLSLFDTLEETMAYAKEWQIPEIIILEENKQKIIKVGE